MKQMRGWAIRTLGIGFLLPVMIFGGFLVIESKHPSDSRELSAVLAETLMAEDTVSPPAAQEGTAWRDIYPVTLPMKIGSVPLQASVAKTWPERIQGLSDTPYLPEEVAKVFVYESDAFHSIWMKDMRYAIDIIWVDATGTVVDFYQNATPDSYPETFTPEVPARYVVEVVAGFVQKHGVAIGTTVELPSL